ncbi:alpha/beta fold hydrolase [Paraburkholderia fungorum]
MAYGQTGLRKKLSRCHADVDPAFYGWNDIWLNPALRTWNIVETLPAIRCPLLEVQGHYNHCCTMAQIATIAEQVPHTQLVKLNACGHSPHRDAPTASNGAIVTSTRSVTVTKHGATPNVGRRCHLVAHLVQDSNRAPYPFHSPGQLHGL